MIDAHDEAPSASGAASSVRAPRSRHVSGVSSSPAAGGTGSLLQSLQWPLDAVMDLPELAQTQLQHWIRSGIQLKTQYSGLGCFELACEGVARAVGHHMSPDLGHGIRTWESADLKPMCRSVLLKHTGPCAPKHVFGNIHDRLPQMQRHELEAVQWPTKAEVQLATDDELESHVMGLMAQAESILEEPECFPSGATSYCYSCRGQCPVEFVGGGTEGLGLGLRVAAAGVTCVDWTIEGDQLGWAGSSAKPCIQWVHERLALKEQIFFQECVLSKELQKYVFLKLGTIYDIEMISLGPQDLGEPHVRTRQWMVGLLRESLVRTCSLASLREVFCKQVITDAADLYFVMNKECVQSIVDKRAAKRMLVPPAGASFNFRETLGQMEDEHLLSYEEIRTDLIANGVLKESSPIIFDLAHNPACKKGMRLSTNLSTLTRNSSRWSNRHQRLMLGVECLASLGIPVPCVLRQLEADCLERSEGVFNMFGWSAPDAFDELSEGNCHQLSGNAMHLKVAGVLFCWTLGHAVPSSVNNMAPAIALNAIGNLDPEEDDDRQQEARELSPLASGCRMNANKRPRKSFD